MYDFKTLSPLDFEELVRDLLQIDLNIRFESFGPGRDQGIDFRFAVAHGPAVVQAKHYSGSDIKALVRTAEKENQKIKQLNPARYIFVTSLSLTPMSKVRLRQVMPDIRLNESDILGKEDLNNLLRRHPEIERKHFKLWLTSIAVLERILKNGIYNRTLIEMDIIKDLVPKFVHNTSVQDAEKILENTKTLIISGIPGVGKTTLARILVWLHAEQDWRISVIDDIKEAFEIHESAEKNLIFFDDFLGQVRLSPDLIRGIDQRLPPFLYKVRNSKNLRFILTTRDYILRQAQSQAGRLDGPMINLSEFTLDVGRYTRSVRAKILFNHLYFSNLAAKDRKELLQNDFFLKIIDHRNFNPRLIGLLTDSDYVSMVNAPVSAVVEHILENPQELWEKPYRNHISDEGKALMLALFFNNAYTKIAVLERSFSRIVKAMELAFGSTDVTSKFRSALKELEGSVLSIQGQLVHFSNPGIRDFLQRTVIQDGVIFSVIKELTEYDEINQCWTFFYAYIKEFNRQSMEKSWCSAVIRLSQNGSGTPLRCLDLFMEIYNEFKSSRLLKPIRKIINVLEAGYIASDEADLCSAVLERLHSSWLPTEELNEAKRTVSVKTAEMLADSGENLSIEDIQSVAGTLLQYGDDEVDVRSGIRSGLRDYMQNINSVLSDFNDAEDVEIFKSDLKMLMDEFDINNSQVLRKIDECIDKLSGVEERMNREEYGPTKPIAFSADISDDQIRSMFQDLQKE